MATGWVHGRTGPPHLSVDRTAHPRQVLAGHLRSLLERPPCHVAFSGGRDSSALLAVAVDVARREGLPLPVPVTERYPDVPESDERDWQEQVIRHLHVEDWVRVDIRDECDLVGEAAGAGLRRRGLIWPAALQTKDEILRRLHGGSLVTGEGGDEVFGAKRLTAWHHLGAGSPDRRATARTALGGLAPSVIRRREIRRALARTVPQPWLRPAAFERNLTLLAEDASSEPLRWDRAVWWLAGRRGTATMIDNYHRVGLEHGVQVEEPMLEPAFLAAFAGMAPPAGYRRRHDAMAAVFGGDLPEAVLRRPSKAAFNRAFFGDPSRAFARRWDGSGLDPVLVDADRLREAWLAPTPSALTGMLLQMAWMASEGIEGPRS